VSQLVLGTRGSPLALWQATHVARLLKAAHPDLEIVERIIRTEGDIQQKIPLSSGSVEGFVRRIEQELLAGTIDLAVHSLKDMPTRQPDPLVIAAVPLRHDPRDALLSPQGWTVDSLPRDAVLGTGSPRRRSQLMHARPDLDIRPVRGNVDTRIGKLLRGDFSALVLALAAVDRLEIDAVPATPIDRKICVPAVGQGALGIETRKDDRYTRDLVAVLEDRPSRIAVDAERIFLDRLGGGCLAPATGHARVENGTVVLEAVVGDLDGTRLLHERCSGAIAEAAALAAGLAERLLASGAGEIPAAARADGEQDG